jgi:hypothetical protein
MEKTGCSGRLTTAEAFCKFGGHSNKITSLPVFPENVKN